MSKKIIIILLLFIILIMIIIGKKIKNQTNIEENNIESKVIMVTAQNFEEEVLNSDKTVLIDFYATWCNPCKKLSPIVEEFAQENEDIKVVKIDVDKQPNLANEYGIISIPTLVVIKNGDEIDRSLGLVNKNRMYEMVK